MVILKSKGFVLRPLRMSDVNDYFEKHDKVAARMFMSVPKNLREARRDLWKMRKKEKKGEGEYFVIEIGGNFSGMVWIDGLTKDRKHRHKAILSYFMGKTHRGKGIMTRAVRLLTAYAFEKYKLKRISASTRSFNKASRRMLEKAGFKLEGILRKNKWKNGKYLDDCVYAKVK